MYAYGHIRWLEESIRMSVMMFYFMKPLDNVFIQIVDDSGMLVYEESVPLSTSQSYCISMQGLLFKPYLIRVEGDNIYEEFFILF